MSEPKRFVLTTPDIAVPSFISKDPEYWFHFLETEFCARNINDDSARFSQLSRKLPEDVLLQVRDTVLAAPEGERYDSVKHAVLTRTVQSERSRFQQLFGNLEVVGKKPSSILVEMRRLLGTSHMDESLLKELWLQKLPDYAQAILVAAKCSL